MQFLVRFHAVANPTMKAREDVVVTELARYWEIVEDHIHAPGEIVTVTKNEAPVESISLIKVCPTCGASDVVAQVRVARIEAV